MTVCCCFCLSFGRLWILGAEQIYLLCKLLREHSCWNAHVIVIVIEKNFKYSTLKSWFAEGKLNVTASVFSQLWFYMFPLSFLVLSKPLKKSFSFQEQTVAVGIFINTPNYVIVNEGLKVQSWAYLCRRTSHCIQWGLLPSMFQHAVKLAKIWWKLTNDEREHRKRTKTCSKWNTFVNKLTPFINFWKDTVMFSAIASVLPSLVFFGVEIHVAVHSAYI